MDVKNKLKNKLKNSFNHKMKIGIEAQRLFRPKKHGLEIVALELIKELQKIDTYNDYIIFVREDLDNNCIQETSNFKIRTIAARSFPEWEQIKLPKAVREENIDILHCTANTAPLFVKAPVILTLHDIIFMEKGKFQGNYYQYMGNIYRKLILPKILKNSKKILTVSKSEKKLILKHFNIADSQITVLYNAVNNSFKKKGEATFQYVRNKYDLPEKFILFFGNSALKKNSHTTIMGYLAYAKRNKNPIPLVIAGAFQDYIQHELGHLHLKKEDKEKIKLIGYIPFEEQPDLYNAATLFLYTSKRESFGMPILESMACGTPVITSSFSSMPEIAGDAAILVDSNNPDKIGEGIKSVLEDTEEYARITELGFQRVKEFSWEQSAKKTIQIYEEVFNSI